MTKTERIRNTAKKYDISLNLAKNWHNLLYFLNLNCHLAYLEPELEKNAISICVNVKIRVNCDRKDLFVSVTQADEVLLNIKYEGDSPQIWNEISEVLEQRKLIVKLN